MSLSRMNYSRAFLSGRTCCLSDTFRIFVLMWTKWISYLAFTTRVSIDCTQVTAHGDSSTCLRLRAISRPNTANYRYLSVWFERPRRNSGKVPKWGHPSVSSRYSLILLDELIEFLRGSYTEPVDVSLEMENKRREREKKSITYS